MEDIIYASTAALADAIRQKEVSSEEVVSAHLDRIEAVNPALNAVVQVSGEEALEQARAADAALATGVVPGPLHGVPMTIKDNLDTAGIISTGGTQGRAAFVPEEDATVVARLRSAGSILLGKTNTPELTLAYETDNVVYGRTNNPYDLDRTPGGSSGGSAAILAAGGTPFEIGSDTGGSLRVPSHFCGTAAIRPTSGRVSRAGHILPPFGSLEALTTIGPMARSVGDLGLILPIIAGSDWQDPAVVDMPLEDPGAVDLSAMRVAVQTDNNVVPASPDVAAAVMAAASALEAAGPVVAAVTPPGDRTSLRAVPQVAGRRRRCGCRWSARGIWHDRAECVPRWARRAPQRLRRSHAG
jgi:amidase